MLRRALLASTPALLLAACGSTGGLPPPPNPVDVSAALAALNGLIAATQAEIAAGGLSATAYAAASAKLADLQAAVDKLTASAGSATQSTIANIFDYATNILQQIGVYLPVILQLIGTLGVLAVPAGSSQSRLRSNYLALKALAGR